MSRHRGCVICGQFHRYQAGKHAEVLRKMRAVYSACLTVSEPFSRKALAQEKQEAPGVDAPKASTAHPVCDTEVRAASAQSDTDRLR